MDELTIIKLNYLYTNTKLSCSIECMDKCFIDGSTYVQQNTLPTSLVGSSNVYYLLCVVQMSCVEKTENRYNKFYTSKECFRYADSDSDMK